MREQGGRLANDRFDVGVVALIDGRIVGDPNNVRTRTDAGSVENVSRPSSIIWHSDGIQSGLRRGQSAGLKIGDRLDVSIMANDVKAPRRQTSGGDQPEVPKPDYCYLHCPLLSLSKRAVPNSGELAEKSESDNTDLPNSPANLAAALPMTPARRSLYGMRSVAGCLDSTNEQNRCTENEKNPAEGCRNRRTAGDNPARPG